MSHRNRRGAGSAPVTTVSCLAVVAIAALAAVAPRAAVGAGPAGAGRAAAAADDGRAIRAAAKTFFDASDEGDLAAAKAATISGEADAALLQATIDWAVARERLAAVARRRFDRAVPRLDNDARNMMLDQIESGPLKIRPDGRAALFSGPDDAKPMLLRKVGGQWKLDLAEMNRAQDLAKNLPNIRGNARAAAIVAEELVAGRFETAKEAVERLDHVEKNARRLAALPEPKVAAFAFLTALGEGDVAAAEAAAVVETDAEADAVRTVAESWGVLKRLNVAGSLRFGRGGAYAGNQMLHRMAFYVEHGDLTVDGDTAVIAAGQEAGMYPKRLKKVDGTWKVVAASLLETNTDPTLVPVLKATAAAEQDVLDDLNAGRFKAAAEFHRELADKSSDAMLRAK